MTQRIFKKSNEQDMIDLFNILPDWVETIEYHNSASISLENARTGLYIDSDILNIDFETDKKEEMTIERPREE